MNKNIICIQINNVKKSKICVSGFYIAYSVYKNVVGFLATT